MPTLQQLVTDYENELCRSKANSTPQSILKRRSLYDDFQYIKSLQSNPIITDFDLFFACVFNRNRHLWLMTQTLATTTANALLNGNLLLRNYRSFEDLYDQVRTLIINIHGIGDVACYDISLRIGFILGIYPDNMAYYHTKLRDSARVLLRVKRVHSFRTDIANFRPLLSNMPAAFIEDFLCAKHDQFTDPNFTIGTIPVTFKYTIASYFK